MTPALPDGATSLFRFQLLWQRCQLDGSLDDSAAIYQRLVDGYNEPQRHYHTMAHIEHCMAMFNECKSLVENADALELSIWFHDVIFEPGKPDNEARSAELYLEYSDGVHAADLRELVARLIMATLHDGSSLEDSDAAFMVDIDLSSFGLCWEAFLKDSGDLRAENPGLSDAKFYRNKAEFLTKLRARERFFLSDFFYPRFEQQAHRNIDRYFEQIRDFSEG